jgi:hypothetical protein
MTRDPYPPEAWPPRLAQLITAARAPARPVELAGEEPVAAAFRAALTAPPPRRMFARLLAVKIAAGGLVLAAGGYAVAAAAGAVPGPSFRPAPTPAPVVTSAPAPPPGASVAATPTPTPSPTGPSAPVPRPAEAYTGLCRAYLNAPVAQAARLLDTPPMRDLVAAAGGRDGVREFCADATAPPAPSGGPEKKNPRTAGPPSTFTRHSPPGGGPV